MSEKTKATNIYDYLREQGKEDEEEKEKKEEEKDEEKAVASYITYCKANYQNKLNIKIRKSFKKVIHIFKNVGLIKLQKETFYLWTYLHSNFFNNINIWKSNRLRLQKRLLEINKPAFNLHYTCILSSILKTR